MRVHRTRSLLLLALLATASLLLAACGGDDDATTGGTAGEAENEASAELPDCPVDALDSATGPVEVVLWHSYVAKTKETLEKLAAEYNASQDKVRVTVESQGNSYDELWDQYQRSAQAGELPAIAILEDTATQSVVESGTVLPAQSCIDADQYDTSDLVQTGIDYYSIDGAFYPGTINMSSPLLYVNKNHLRQAGLDPETAPATLADLRDVAQAIKDAGITETPLAMNLTAWYIETWLTGEGDGVVDNDNGRGDGETTAAVFDDEATTELMQWIKDMHDDGLLLAIPLVPGNIDHLRALAGEEARPPRASMTFETSTAATSIVAFLGGDQSVLSEAAGEGSSANVSGIDIDAVPMPGVSEAGQVQIGGGAWYLTLDQPAEVQAAAWDFLKWWNTPATQERWNIEGSYIPFNQRAAESPAVQQFWDTNLAGSWLEISYQQLSQGVDPAWPGPLIGPYQEVRTAIEDALDQLVLDGKTPEEVLPPAQQQATDAIQRFNEGGF